MNPVPLPSPGAPAPAPVSPLEELRRSVDALRGLLNAALFLVIVLATGLNIFLYRQVTLGRRQVADTNETLTNYEKNMRPAVHKFLTQMDAFARTNADFAPIMTKYFPPPPVVPPPPAASAR